MKKAVLFLIILVPVSELFAQNHQSANVQPQQDTAVYKPDSYQMRGNASVDQLLKIMKGFKIGDDGTVFHDGFQVNRAKINNKEYVGVNIAKAIRRLPAEAVINITMIDDGSADPIKDGKPGNPQEILNIIINEDAMNYPSAFSGDRQYRQRGGRFMDGAYVARYGEPVESNPRNPNDRAVDRAISNMQAITSSMYEVNEWGDQIPHFIIKEWPGPGKPKMKKDKKAETTPSEKPAQ